MTATSSPSNTSGRSDAVQILGRHFPAEVQAAYARFRETRAPADADLVVLAVMLDHLPDKKLRPSGPPADSLGLVADLGFDSVAITDTTGATMMYMDMQSKSIGR